MFRTDLYIGGNWRSASDGGRFDVINPADETILVSVASATETDALAAVDAAHSAMKNWAAKPPRNAPRSFGALLIS
jgi:succinate-semialdehyde dehydrogenase / glutarate-semialdehyde dehydrogenase